MTGKNAVIIVAAGGSKRFGSSYPKQFVSLLGNPLFIYSVKTFLESPLINEIVILVPQRWKRYTQRVINKFKIKKTIRIYTGGKRRQDTVYRGLCKVSRDIKYVLIHDAARPLVTQKLIKKVIKGADTSGCCIPVVSPADTVKEIDGRGFIRRTIHRKMVGLVQTPQAFRYEIIMNAYKRNDSRKTFTDDAQLAETLGRKVKVIEGEQTNIKVTWREDIAIAEGYLKSSPIKKRI